MQEALVENQEKLTRPNKKIFIRPIDKETWHKKKGEENFKRPHGITALVDPYTGKYATGLTEEEAAQYGKELGIDLSDTFIAERPHPYWDSPAARIKLLNTTMILNTSILRDYIKYKVLLASKYVANSLSELSQGLFPDATHVMEDEEVEIVQEATKIQSRRDCYAALHDIDFDGRVNLCYILGEEPIGLRKRSPNFIDVELEKIIDAKPKELLRWIKADKGEIFIRAVIEEALERNILTKEGASIHYMGEPLAMDKESLVTFFLDANNQNMKAIIINRVKGNSTAPAKATPVPQVQTAPAAQQTMTQPQVQGNEQNNNTTNNTAGNTDDNNK